MIQAFNKMVFTVESAIKNNFPFLQEACPPVKSQRNYHLLCQSFSVQCAILEIKMICLHFTPHQFREKTNELADQIYLWDNHKIGPHYGKIY